MVDHEWLWKSLNVADSSRMILVDPCRVYTSDAADDLTCIVLVVGDTLTYIMVITGRM